MSELSRPPLNDRICSILYWPALILAWLDAALIGIPGFQLPTIGLQAALGATAALAALHFVWSVFDRPTQRAVQDANRIIRDEFGIWPSWALARDPEWGLFGSFFRDRPLFWANRVLWFEMAAMMIVGGGDRYHPAPGLLLAFAGFFLTTVVLISQVKYLLPEWLAKRQHGSSP